MSAIVIDALIARNEIPASMRGAAIAAWDTPQWTSFFVGLQGSTALRSYDEKEVATIKGLGLTVEEGRRALAEEERRRARGWG